MSKDKAPDEIWLQYYDEVFETETATGDVTWCDHKINESDVRYVHPRVVSEAVKKYLSPDYIMDKGASPIQIQRKIMDEVRHGSPESGEDE